MTANQIKALAEDGESEQVEFKETTGQRQRAAETVCAMLNGAGAHWMLNEDRS